MYVLLVFQLTKGVLAARHIDSIRDAWERAGWACNLDGFLPGGNLGAEAAAEVYESACKTLERAVEESEGETVVLLAHQSDYREWLRRAEFVTKVTALLLFTNDSVQPRNVRATVARREQVVPLAFIGDFARWFPEIVARMREGGDAQGSITSQVEEAQTHERLESEFLKALDRWPDLDAKLDDFVRKAWQDRESEVMAALQVDDVEWEEWRHKPVREVVLWYRRYLDERAWDRDRARVSHEILARGFLQRVRPGSAVARNLESFARGGEDERLAAKTVDVLHQWPSVGRQVRAVLRSAPLDCRDVPASRRHQVERGGVLIERLDQSVAAILAAAPGLLPLTTVDSMIASCQELSSVLRSLAVGRR